MRRKQVLAGIGLALILVTVLPLIVLAQDQPPIPRPPETSGDYVLDTLNWLSDSQEAAINSTVAALDSAGLAEIAVVTLDDCGQDKQMFRNDLFRSWGIGHSDDNDGLLVLVCWYGGDKSRRSLEQEVGYGMEGTIPDLITSKVANQYFVAAFKAGPSAEEVVVSGKAGDALVAMVKAYDGIIRGEIPAELESPDINPWIIIAIAVLIILVLLLFVGMASGSSGGSWSSGSTWSGSDTSSSSDGGSSFGGGSSGGGGSSTGF